jgi:succinyl-diaminopimelate desuccinylase
MTAVALTQELLRFNTINPGQRERPCAERVAHVLEEGGFAVEMHEFAPGRASVLARLGAAGAPLAFVGHLDTVPLGAAPWKHDPFAGETSSGRLYGRGSSDMKSGVAAMVEACLRLSKLRSRKAGLLVALVAGEETGCEGSQHLARSARLENAVALVVGEPTGNQPVVGHKGALWLRARARGVTAHGSMPQVGVNAVYKAARAALKIEELRFDVAPDSLLGGPTANVGTFAGGLNVNSVPDEATFTIDIRTIPAQRHAQVRAQIVELLGPDIELTPMVDLEGIRTDERHPFVQSAIEAIERATGVRPEPGAATYFTDGSVLAPALGKPPAIVLGPGEMALCHQTDEWCSVEKIDQAVEAYVAIGERWCSP